MKIITCKEAIEQGLKYYFTGEPCVNGHTDRRLVSNFGCVPCSYARTKKTRHKYYEKAKVRSKKHYQDNKEIYNQRSQKRYNLYRYDGDWIAKKKHSKERRKQQQKYNTLFLADIYIKSVIIEYSKTIKGKDIPDWMLKLKRAGMMLRRKYYET